MYHGDARTTFVKQADGTYTNGTVPAFRGAQIMVDGYGTRTLRYKDGRTVMLTGNIGVTSRRARTTASGGPSVW
jgi:hypothetical protein